MELGAQNDVLQLLLGFFVCVEVDLQEGNHRIKFRP